MTDENWLSVSEAESKNKKFIFKHHSTASVIELVIKKEDTKEESVWFDYYEWEELCDFLNNLNNTECHTPPHQNNPGAKTRHWD